jgi:hypothetical protein
MSKTNFVDGDPSRGILGTVVTADFLNALNKHYHTGLDQDGHGALPYATDTGTANAYVVNLNPALTQYVNGMPIFFKATNASTGASTINVNGLGIKPIKKNITLNLVTGDIQVGQIIMVLYDGANFQLIGGLDAHTVDGYHASATPTANTIAVSGSNSRLAWGWKPAFRGVLVSRYSSSSINNSTETAIDFATANSSESYDTDSFHDLNTNSTRLTIPGGSGITKIRLSASVSFGVNATGQRKLFLRKNTSFAGPGLSSDSRNACAATNTVVHLVTSPVAVAEGDYFELFAWQNSGAALTIDLGSGSETWFAMEIIE